MKNPVNYNVSGCPDFLLIDLFCGAGGTTTGAEMSGKSKVIAAINHDATCIASHTENHPDVLHFREDVRKTNLEPLFAHLTEMRKKYPNAKVILWASLECTHFSNAKGGGARNADSRTLAYCLRRYVKVLNPDYIQIENVREFLSWGPLDENGKPISKNKGISYVRWVKMMQKLCGGYNYNYRLMNAADFGAFTSRLRFYGCFAKIGLPIVFPEPTHAKKKPTTRFDGMKPWKAVREVLDLEDLGNSVFNRKKPLVDKTLLRLYRGLEKFAPRTQKMLMTHTSPGHCDSLEQPCGTITTAAHKSLISPVLMSYYGKGECHEIDKPCGTLTTNDRYCLVSPKINWIHYNFSSTKTGHSLDSPLWALTTSPKAELATATSWLVNPGFSSNGTAIDQPSPTIVASQSSFPLSVAQAKPGLPVFQVCETDTPTMLKLKALCIKLGIGDIFLRMLSVGELSRIQGFPTGYRLLGDVKAAKKQIGNSVVPLQVKAWHSALADALRQQRSQN